MKNPFVSIKNVAYAVVPATWPNRAIRRAVLFGKTLPTEWAIFLMDKPDHVKLIRKQALA